ncbi:epimerase [Euzebya sp.]|uniref:epimerase n=1 Tax=Euzebya sp. TaxID=1971409 RepID=UPI00351678BB
MSARTALVIGGTGPTGPPLVEGLLERGLDTTIFHTGRHEVPDGPDVPHLHGDPYDADGIADALGDGRWDVVIATYGRVRLLAQHVAGRCEHFLAVGGTPVYDGYIDPHRRVPTGMDMPVHEDHPLVPVEDREPVTYRTGAIRRTEDTVFELGRRGAFGATYLRYPTVYGPRNPHAWEWTVVRRVLDGRPWMILSDDGRGIHSRAGAANAAHAILCAVDHPEAAAQQAYNVADDELVSIRQWAELTALAAGGDLPIRSLPGELPSPGWGVIAFGYQATPSCVLDTSKIREQLGYADVMSVRDGLAETVEWMLAHREEMDANPNLVDPFDYAAEDRLVAAYDAAMASVAEAAEPFRAIVGRMTVPQTAKGARAGGS